MTAMMLTLSTNVFATNYDDQVGSMLPDNLEGGAVYQGSAQTFYDVGSLLPDPNEGGPVDSGYSHFKEDYSTGSMLPSHLEGGPVSSTTSEPPGFVNGVFQGAPVPDISEMLPPGIANNIKPSLDADTNTNTNTGTTNTPTTVPATGISLLARLF